ncbi:MAG: hypothetical protein ACLPJY_00685 [Rhodomicrobium sp.]
MGRDRIRLAFHRPAKTAYYSDRLLARAVKFHTEGRVFLIGRRTVIAD